MTADTSQRARRLAGPWRVVFATYALALAVATHWPALSLQTVGGPAPDKLLHMIAFGILAALLWRTAWLRRRWHVALVAVIWTVLDEVSQGVPVLRRTVSWQDMTGGLLGVLVVLVWLWALAPIGGPASRLRSAATRMLLDEIAARPATWILAGVVGVSAAAVTGGVSRMVPQYIRAEPRELAVLVAAVFVGGCAGAWAATAILMRRRRRSWPQARPCFSCGASCRGASFDESGTGRCPACGRAVHAAQWIICDDPGGRGALRGLGPAIATAVALELAAMALYGAVLAASAQLTAARRLLRWWDSLAPDLQFAVDLAIAATAVAVAVRVYRRVQARRFDRQDTVCRACGHDLTGAVMERGTGRCPECGTLFGTVTVFPATP